MPKKAKLAAAGEKAPVGPRPRLVKLIIRNFRCIGTTPVSIDLDDIVVLVGPNNVGKSSVLKAYEVIMSEGSVAGQLTLEDFPLGKVNPEALPEIELHTVVHDDSPGPEWIAIASSGEKLVREQWRWSSPGPPTRRGYNVLANRWANADDSEKVPWGLANVANARRPQAHRVDAFASPDAQAEEIVKLLMAAIRERVKSHQAMSETGKASDHASLLAGIAAFQKKVVAESQEQIMTVQAELTDYVGRVFPGHRVVFDAKPEDDLDKTLNLFKANPNLLMGPEGGYLSTMGRQGSGARRTLLWAAIRLVAESNTKRKADAGPRPHVLLLDEPEICLHPNAIREACDLLYNLPEATGNWQVMVTTHSPCFVDFARDHTSVVRVERGANGETAGTTIYRPSVAQFDGDDREQLKLLNICDPYVAEFFFGGRTIVVEGDTEFTAFKLIMAKEPERYGNVHIVRARGKAPIVSLCKILNQFAAPYAVLHDSDRPTYKKNGREYKNPAWSQNRNILTVVSGAGAGKRLVASIPNFEKAYLGEEVTADKPYNVLRSLGPDSDSWQRIKQLLEALVDFAKPLPQGAVEWSDENQLLGEATAAD